MKYYAKLDNNKHIETFYLEGQLTDTTGFAEIQVPEVWLNLFIRDWTNFYIESDGSLNFDNNKATKTQQQIDLLQHTVNQLLVDSSKD